jgi:hypothetical protein
VESGAWWVEVGHWGRVFERYLPPPLPVCLCFLSPWGELLDSTTSSGSYCCTSAQPETELGNHGLQPRKPRANFNPPSPSCLPGISLQQWETDHHSPIIWHSHQECMQANFLTWNTCYWPFVGHLGRNFWSNPLSTFILVYLSLLLSCKIFMYFGYWILSDIWFAKSFSRSVGFFHFFDSVFWSTKV